MLSSGVDILHVQRVQEALARHGERFLARVYTPAEIAYCRGRAPELAARFAAKEAAAKALGVGMRVLSRQGVGWHEIEIERDVLGKPHLSLTGSAAERAQRLGLIRWSLSIAHEREYAIAFVVASD
ncbi:MAG: holo-ACP synthase [Thermoflexales bacterium]|nr:holo-ACP synthase [Thermoflexales bacterium]